MDSCRPCLEASRSLAVVSALWLAAELVEPAVVAGLAYWPLA